MCGCKGKKRYKCFKNTPAGKNIPYDMNTFFRLKKDISVHSESFKVRKMRSGSTYNYEKVTCVLISGTGMKLKMTKTLYKQKQ